MTKKLKAGPVLYLILLAAIIVLPVIARAEDDDISNKFFVPPPPFSPGIFPCSQCHRGMPVNKHPRKLQMHQEIADNFKHMPGGWCFDCHNPDNRDKLRLANGKLVSFKKSYILCGQCHGVVLRDWKVGLHGKRTGMWNGKKEYRLCVNCHWPHNPPFKAIKPLPPPVRPADIK